MEKEIQYKKGTLKDLDPICEMIQKAIAEMNSKAICQWDEKYPARSDFLRDIEQRQLTVGMVNGKPACIYVLSKECDAEYESANWTDQNGNYYVKRVVGLPGEKVQIKNGRIYVNGKKTKAYSSQKILSAGLASEEITLKSEQYFVVGDNYNNSEDSRSASVGNIKRSNIVGKVGIKYWQ